MANSIFDFCRIWSLFANPVTCIWYDVFLFTFMVQSHAISVLKLYNEVVEDLPRTEWRIVLAYDNVTLTHWMWLGNPFRFSHCTMKLAICDKGTPDAIMCFLYTPLCGMYYTFYVVTSNLTFTYRLLMNCTSKITLTRSAERSSTTPNCSLPGFRDSAKSSAQCQKHNICLFA